MIGQKISELRLQANMTQEELAEKLFITRQLVSAWENGLRRPDYATIKAISVIFDTDADKLIKPESQVLSELQSCFENPNDYNSDNITVILNGFLKTLSDKDCKIFVSRYYLFESTKEIASALDIKDGTVRTSLSRTKSKLKKYITEVSSNE